ncbi:GNAT family N-acetyltransferase [Paenibacillus sedimenti]|uniref:GNAT family N-acetyltransferase n=1 Tax=Paenibacillus sedimenti TaxID=2770274 RepID=A0A926KWK7_9BACL|nr:GNAT family N-acetyltransferase [Paenibacillus sedimenti]MBD0384892.1 GNAT family N-acetyltransferase [Paenibacillus sedimenti]
MINYRRAILQDEQRVFDLAKKLATSAVVNEKDFKNVYLQLLEDGNVDIFVAELESRLIGYVLAFHHHTFYANGLISWVEELYVDEEYRGKYIGKALMELIEDAAKNRNSKLIALATRRASKFYEAIGYEQSATYYKRTL